MTTRDEMLRIAENLRDYRGNMVEQGRGLAMFVLLDEKDRRALVDNLSAVQARCTELLEDRRRLCKLVERLRDSSFEESKSIIADLVVACRGMQ